MAVATLVANFLSFGGSLGTTKFCPQRKRRGRLFSTTAAAATLIRNAQEATEELLIVVGGGAAGVFAAIRSKTIAPHLRVMVVEKGRLLSKVKVSGGGRCNVTNGHSVDRLVLAEHYPRGNKELRGSFFNLHGPRDTISWFSDHGVELKTEDDGRVFPVSNSSSSIIDCLLLKAKSNGGSLASTQFGVTRARDVGGVLLTWEILVGLMLAAAANNGSTTSSFFSTGKTVTSASCTASGKFILKIEKRSVDFVEDIEADYLLIASGSSCQGHAIAVQLGHSIIQPMPSLFTFKIEDPRLLELSGVTLPKVKAKLKIPEASRNIPQYTQVGPMLVTHWGLSGPIILRLSAWGARDLYNSNYKGILFVDFVPDLHIEYVKDILIQHKNQLGKQKVLNSSPPQFALVKRFWKYLLEREGLGEDNLWASISNNSLKSVAFLLKQCSFNVIGKGPFKDEFVTAGGVPLSEISLNTMQSKIRNHLFFAGEVLNVDGITGGFNFQNAWTGGYIAGTTIGRLASGEKMSGDQNF